MPPLHENLLACPDCDLLQRVPALPAGGKARCPRCGRIVAARKRDSLDRTLALTVAAAIAFVVAHAAPLMDLSAVGRTASTTLIGAAHQVGAQGEKITALLVGFCVVVAPAVHILLMLALLFAARHVPAPSWTGTLLRWLEANQPWAMVEVLMLGLLVAVVKIAELAEVRPGVGMFATGALIFLLAAMNASFDPEEVWQRVPWSNGEGPPPPGGPGPKAAREAGG